MLVTAPSPGSIRSGHGQHRLQAPAASVPGPGSISSGLGQHQLRARQIGSGPEQQRHRPAATVNSSYIDYGTLAKLDKLTLKRIKSKNVKYQKHIIVRPISRCQWYITYVSALNHIYDRYLDPDPEGKNFQIRTERNARKLVVIFSCSTCNLHTFFSCVNANQK